jgi:hypothetical protein
VPYEPSNIEVVKVKPLLDELAQRCGSLEQAAEYAGIGVSSAYRIARQEHRTMQAGTARLIILALYERRKEDRRNGAGEAFLKARKKQAEIEERMGRLAGY